MCREETLIATTTNFVFYKETYEAKENSSS
jgi:hypothetical protein